MTMLQNALASVPPELMPVLVFVLVLAGTLGMVWVVLDTFMSSRIALRRRLELAGGLEPRTAAAGSDRPVSTPRTDSSRSRSSRRASSGSRVRSP